MEALLNPDGARSGVFSLDREVHGNGDRYFGDSWNLAGKDLDVLMEEVGKERNTHPNESRFLNWKDVYPGADD